MPKKYNKRADGKNDTGRPTKYRPEYCEQIVEFFSNPTYNIKDMEIRTEDIANKIVKTVDKTELEPNDLPTLIMFAMKIGVDVLTLERWAKTHSKFCSAFEKAKRLQENFLVQNGLRGMYNPAIAALCLKNNHGWKDKTDVNLGGEISQFIIKRAK